MNVCLNLVNINLALGMENPDLELGSIGLKNEISSCTKFLDLANVLFFWP